MSGDINKTEGEGSVKSAEFDPVKFRTDLLDSVAAQNKVLLETVLASKTNSVPERKVVVTADEGFDIKEFEEEMSDINVDERQMKGIVRAVSKILRKEGPKLSEEIETKVDTKLSLKDQKIAFTQESKMKYPDISDKSSKLFQLARQIYREEMTDVSRSAPDAEAIATERAAARLQIKPLTINDIRSSDALMPTGDAGINEKKGKELDKGFASYFGVDHEKANAKFKEINARSSPH